MKLVVGLGNPGRRYGAHRHNVGFRVVEAFAARARIALDAERFGARFGVGMLGERTVGVLEPQGFMNASGDSVAQALAELPVEDPARDLLVVFDDADLPLGRLRLRERGSDGGHRGLRDVLAGTGEQVPRLRFGIGRPTPLEDTRDFVLAPFDASEEDVLAEAVPRAVDAIVCALEDGLPAAMSRFNATAPPANDTVG